MDLHFKIITSSKSLENRSDSYVQFIKSGSGCLSPIPRLKCFATAFSAHYMNKEDGRFGLVFFHIYKSSKACQMPNTSSESEPNPKSRKDCIYTSSAPAVGKIFHSPFLVYTLHTYYYLYLTHIIICWILDTYQYYYRIISLKSHRVIGCRNPASYTWNSVPISATIFLSTICILQ
jgi:hypothetical protein